VKFTKTFAASGLVVCGVLLGAAVMQDEGELQDGGMDPAFMQAWMEYMTPAEGQARLATRVGTWEVTIRHWMSADAPVEESSGQADYEMIMDGRFLAQRYEAEFDGMGFEGAGVSAHNNKTKKFQFTWLDNMGTGLMQGSGEFKGDVLHWTAVATDPLMGDVSMRGTETFDDPDRFVATMYYPGPDGKEFKMMELIYVRANSDHPRGDHPHAAHPGHDHPKGDHPKGDHPKGDHPKGDHPKGDHPN
jgi:hypothetical protein